MSIDQYTYKVLQLFIATLEFAEI